MTGIGSSTYALPNGSERIAIQPLTMVDGTTVEETQ